MNIYDKIADLEQKANDTSKGAGKAPVKPNRALFKTHTEFGMAMDEYDALIVEHRKKRDEYRVDAALVYKEIETLIKKESRISELPEQLCEKFWRLACEAGHSSGYSEIYNCAIDFEDIVEDILKFKNGL